MLLKHAPGWDRTGDDSLVSVLNDAQNLLLQTESEQAVLLEDGDLPSLETTDTGREYEIEDAWRIDAVLLEYPLTSEYSDLFYVDYGSTQQLQKPIEERIFNGKKYARVQQVKTRDRLDDDTPAKITFLIDPQSLTYKLVAYEHPTQITSERVNPSIRPESLQLRALYPSALALIKGYENGDMEEAIQKIERIYRPMVQHTMNGGEQAATSFVKRNVA